MKKRLLSLLCLLFSVSAANAQWANQTSSWNYGFTSWTNNTTNSGTTNATYLSSDVTPVLPAPPTGTAMFYFSANTSSSITIDATNNKLTMVPSVTGSVSKFSVYTVSNATEIAYSKFALTFSRVNTAAPANGTTYVWSLGNRSATGNLYSNSNAVNLAAGAAQSLFTALRWVYNATNDNYAMGYRVGSSSTAQSNTTLSGGAYSPDIPYVFEVYANNSTQSKQYTKGVLTYTVPAGNFHVWATNTITNAVIRPYIGSNQYDLPKSVETNSTTGDQSIPNNISLNSFLFQGSANTNGNSKIIINGGIELAYNQTTLPVSLISFTGRKALSGVALNWTTASEQNNDYFELFRSADGQKFIPIAKITGKGNSSELSQYAYTDKNPLAGYNYYQLKQVDKDGTVNLLQENVAVKYGLDQNDYFTISAQENTLNIMINAANADTAEFYVYDLQGRKLTQAKLNLTAGQHSYSVDASNLSRGMFIAKMATKNGVQSVKFLR